MTGGGAIDASVTLDEVFAVVGTKRVPLAPELAGYLVLEIAEHADPGGGDVDPRSVYIGEEGSVALVKARREAAIEGAEASVRATLARLLEASGTQTPALAAVAKRRSGAGLSALAEEIEAALIPVNRAAGRRALARLAREVKRVTLGVGRNALPSVGDLAPSSRRASSPSSPSQPSHPPQPAQPSVPPRETSPGPSSSSFSKEEEPTTTRSHIPEELLRKATPAEWSEMPTVQFEPPRPPSPSQADVDHLIDQFSVSGGGEQQQARELKAMAGLEPTPPPPTSGGARLLAGDGAPLSARDADVEALLALGADAPSVRPKPGASSRPDDRQLPTQPSQRKVSVSPLPPPPSAPKPRGNGGLIVVALLAIGGGAVGVWQLKPFAASAPAPPPQTSAAAASATTTPACTGTLVVTDVPAHAEALLRAGQAPVDVEKMPVGTRLEFVATAEGYAPRRVVVPAGAAWDRGPDGKPRFEAAAQLDKSKVKAGTNDPWPAGEPGSEVGGQGPPGTVHVVTTPRGAEVWMLAGIGPEVRIEQLRCDQDIEVLIAGPTTFRRRLHVATSDFVSADASDEGGTPQGPARPRGPGGAKMEKNEKIARVSAK
jgi:hypothetical protein